MVWNSGVVVESLPAPSRWRAILRKMRHAAKGGTTSPALILGAGGTFHLGLGAALCAMGLGVELGGFVAVWCARWGVDALCYTACEGDLWGG